MFLYEGKVHSNEQSAKIKRLEREDGVSAGKCEGEPQEMGSGGKRTTSALLTVGSPHLARVPAHSNCWINADGMNKWLRDAEKQIRTRKGWKYMFKEEEGERNQCFWVMGTREREREASKDDGHVFWSSDKTCTKGGVKAYNWKKQVCKAVLPRTKYWIKNSEWIQSLDFQEDKLLKICVTATWTYFMLLNCTLKNA